MPTCLRKVVTDRLRKQGKLRKISEDELAAHNAPESGWIAVDGAVYDITVHVLHHSGWNCGCAVSELMAILRCLGEYLRCTPHHSISLRLVVDL